MSTIWRRDASGFYAITAIGSELPYSLDWADVFGAGRNVATATWTLPAPVQSVAQSNSGAVATVWLRPTSAGTHEIACTVVSSGSPAMKETREFRLVVTD